MRENPILDGFECQNERSKLVSKVKAICVFIFYFFFMDLRPDTDDIFNKIDLTIFAIDDELEKGNMR